MDDSGGYDSGYDTAVAADYDGDGVADYGAVDYTGDGVADYEEADTTGDGYADVAVADYDGDGYADVAAVAVDDAPAPEVSSSLYTEETTAVTGTVDPGTGEFVADGVATSSSTLYQDELGNFAYEEDSSVATTRAT